MSGSVSAHASLLKHTVSAMRKTGRAMRHQAADGNLDVGMNHGKTRTSSKSSD